MLTILKDFYKIEILSPTHKFDIEGHYAQVRISKIKVKLILSITNCKHCLKSNDF